MLINFASYYLLVKKNAAEEILARYNTHNNYYIIFFCLLFVFYISPYIVFSLLPLDYTEDLLIKFKHTPASIDLYTVCGNCLQKCPHASTQL